MMQNNGADPAFPPVPTGSAAPAAPRGFRLPRLTQTPLLPEAGAGGAPLIAVITVISALAALALAAFVLIRTAADEWTDDLAASLTVQVKGADIAEIETRTKAALAILKDSPGILESKVVTSAEAAKLLEPWLGKGASVYLNVPALIEVKADPAAREDLGALRLRLNAAAPGLVLDDHGEWNRMLSAAARSGQALAFGVFALILGAACAIAFFAARAGLAANAEIVSLLHLIGATDPFIANEVQRRFLSIGLKGSLAGLSIAVLALLLAALAAQGQGAASDFLPIASIGPSLILPLMVVPATVCLATAVTARFTVIRLLRREY